MRAARHRLNRLLRGQVPVRLTLVMSVLVLLMYMNDTGLLIMFAGVLAPAALLLPLLLQSKWCWYAIAALTAVGLAPALHAADNHKYLTVYWFLAVSFSLFMANPRQALAWHGRVLIGLCFGFALAWKLMAPEFRGGEFFYLTLLTDGRFADMAKLTAGVTPELAEQNMTAFGTVMASTERVEAVYLQSTPWLPTVALALAIWTFIEGWVAAAFLAPRGTWISRCRDVPLVTFIVTTYAVAPVTGFAALLAVMGFAQCSHENRRWRPVYLGLFIAVPLFALPFELMAMHMLRMFNLM